ncbi:FAD-binding protein [Epibacterium ulvae]|uniref:FAD-binding protein n=1 Tax=Epibacterium ulvae TaxID=1156985 RepID=UPI001BFC456F|nr:FAD-binding protein [Epibacterium ulvae]
MTPTDETELAAAIAQADGPLSITSGGTRGIATAGTGLSTRAMTGVTLYEPGALTMVARSGTPLDEVQSQLVKEGQQLAFEPADYRGLLGTNGAPTLGGAFASNSSGPRRVQAGAARDFLLGVRFVDGRGTVLKNGGRVMKNVTGYDLVKLMAGAHGTLGVMSEVSFKVLPKPECTGTLVWEGLAPAQSLQVFTAAMRSPFDVTGAARVPSQGDAPSQTMIRLEGFESSVQYRMQQLQKKLQGIAQPQSLLDADALWRMVRDVEPFHGQVGAVWRSSIKPSDMPAFIDRIPGDHLVDWAGGLVWSLVDPSLDLRGLRGGIGGHSTLVRSANGVQPFARFEPQPSPLETLAQGLRTEFDPRGILNPGLMG